MQNKMTFQCDCCINLSNSWHLSSDLEMSGPGDIQTQTVRARD